ncbi:MAG TPA: hypothetical protein VJ953_21235 [Saprospiraceae bacterium]|nr:hypothetical protein [Saprospiraceae bacterium]
MRYTLLCAFLLLGLSAKAQSYNTAAGLRLGTDWGLTVKQRVYDNITGEFIVQSSLFRDETMLTLLAAQHQRFIGKRFNIYYGGGIHKGWLPAEFEGSEIRDPFGIDFIGGIDLTIAGINISYDLKPGVNLSGGQSTIFLQSGLSARYVFAKNDRLSWEPDNRTLRKKRREKRRKKRRRRKGKGN